MDAEYSLKLFLSTETYDPISALIRWNTRCPWSHAGFIRESDGATFSAMIDGGVQWRPPIKKALGLLLDVAGVDEAFDWAVTQEGKHYDWRAILGLTVDRSWRERRRWFCSELVAAAFEKINRPLLNFYVPVAFITPRDLMLSPLIQPVRRFCFSEYIR